jgi:hypothetical protein
MKDGMGRVERLSPFLLRLNGAGDLGHSIRYAGIVWTLDGLQWAWLLKSNRYLNGHRSSELNGSHIMVEPI